MYQELYRNGKGGRRFKRAEIIAKSKFWDGNICKMFEVINSIIFFFVSGRLIFSRIPRDFWKCFAEGNSRFDTSGPETNVARRWDKWMFRLRYFSPECKKTCGWYADFQLYLDLIAFSIKIAVIRKAVKLEARFVNIKYLRVYIHMRNHILHDSSCNLMFLSLYHRCITTRIKKQHGLLVDKRETRCIIFRLKKLV